MKLDVVTAKFIKIINFCKYKSFGNIVLNNFEKNKKGS